MSYEDCPICEAKRFYEDGMWGSCSNPNCPSRQKRTQRLLRVDEIVVNGKIKRLPHGKVNEYRR